MDAFAWLSKLIEAMASLIPRLVIIRSTSAGVRWRGGKKVMAMKPGLHIYWPLTTEVEIVVTARQSTNLLPQILTTKDNIQITVSATIVHSIYDPVRAIGEVNWDVHGTISDISQTSIVEVISRSTYQELATGLASDLEKRLTASAKKRLRRYGVMIHKCSLRDFAMCRVYRVIQNV